jgi:hypothetical protein
LKVFALTIAVVGYSPDSNEVSTEDEEYPSVEVVARKRLLETVID